MPYARPEETARAALVAFKTPELYGLVDEPYVDGETGCRKGPFCYAGGAEAETYGEEGDAVAEGDAGVACRIGPGEHA